MPEFFEFYSGSGFPPSGIKYMSDYIPLTIVSGVFFDIVPITRDQRFIYRIQSDKIMIFNIIGNDFRHASYDGKYIELLLDKIMYP